MSCEYRKGAISVRLKGQGVRRKEIRCLSVNSLCLMPYALRLNSALSLNIELIQFKILCL